MKVCASGLSIQCTQGTFDSKALKGSVWSISVFPIFDRITLDHMGVKVSNDIFSECITSVAHKIHAHYLWGVKRIVKFGFW